jgi:hypothetical protein
MFNTIGLGGPRGSIVFGGRPAAVLGAWRAHRSAQGVWTLAATVTQADTFRLRQVPLLFEAPRVSKPRGLWCFPIVPNSITVAGGQLAATLGQPEG